MRFVHELLALGCSICILHCMHAQQETADPVRVSEALRRTGLPITANYVTRLIRAGRIPAERIGAHWYVRPADLTAALVQPGATP